jgi:hypothetical protein
MPKETWARDVDVPAINITATNNDAQRNFATALNFFLQRCRIRWSKVPSSELRIRLMVGLWTNLVCPVVNTRRNSGAVVIPRERFMDEAISCIECLFVGTIL